MTNKDSSRAYRGGSWRSGVDYARKMARCDYWSDSGDGYDNLGFRLVGGT